MRAWAGPRLGGRFWALALKELRQIRGDRRLALSLVVPPMLQILLFGFALDSHVRDLRLGVVDESGTHPSRDLVAAITENQTFRLTGSYHTADYSTFSGLTPAFFALCRVLRFARHSTAGSSIFSSFLRSAFLMFF